MAIPLIWITANHFGYLEYLKTKSLDWRMQFRDEISQDSYLDPTDLIQIEDNRSIPRIPKVVYVNFDSSTLAMDDVGERPWDRAFFRDTSLALIERGNARVLAFDFGFTPKSMSKMVPPQNSYRSDFAMGELVRTYPNRVVLGCLYSGVQTPYVKLAGSSAFPPLFKDGYSISDAGLTNTFNYPESPTYPLINYLDGKFIGRLGSFTVLPFRAVDEIPRWVPLWFPSGGKSHAYNLLGGKRNKLSFDLPRDNEALIADLLSQKSKSSSKVEGINGNHDNLAETLEKLMHKKKELSGEISSMNESRESVREIETVLTNLNNTLKANPGISSIIEPQIASKMREISDLLLPFAGESGSNELPNFDKEKLESEMLDLNTTLVNLKETLDANPALAQIVGAQIELKKNRLSEVTRILNTITQNDPLTSGEILTRKQNLANLIEKAEKELVELDSKVIKAGKDFAFAAEELKQVNESLTQINLELDKLSGDFPTRLVESNNTLMLVYDFQANEDLDQFELVDSVPNQVPLIRDDKFLTLGLEALIAYYGLENDAVIIDKDKKTLTVQGRKGERLINCKLEESQFVEVNWFSKWTAFVEEEEKLREAKKFYVDGAVEQYLGIVRPILLALIQRANVSLVNPNDMAIKNAIMDLGVEASTLEVVSRLLEASAEDAEIPSFDEFNKVVSEMSRFFVSPKMLSEFNPMCGIGDVLDNARFQDQIRLQIRQIELQLEKLNGPNFMGAIVKALQDDPNNKELLQQKDTVEKAIAENERNLAEQQDELAVIDAYFACFNDTIVLIGPEEKTFQDLAPTPFDTASVPKVSVHGNLIKTLTTSKYLKRLPNWIDHAATVVICILLAFLAVYQGNRASIVQFCGLVLLVGYVFFGFWTFSGTHVIWPITTPACAGISTSFVGLAAMVVIEQNAKGKLKGMFGSYVSSDLVEQMVESGEEPKLGGEETAITAFFSDVQAFSSFSELLTPTGLVDLMNEYLTAMTNILQEERGTLDKYIGDAIVAMYGAPIPMADHAYQAVRTSILMQQKQIELRDKWKSEGDKWPDIVAKMQTRIGCNTGTATVGNMGALDRFNYTMMGDMVNLAARCESGAKSYGAYIMITEETKLASEKTKDNIAFRYLDKIIVKGRTQPVAMYEPTGFISELNQETQDCLDCFRSGIDRYLAQDWDGALQMFEKAKQLEPNKPGITPGVVDNPSMILIDRCQIMKENPPGDDWDGVYVMTTK